MSGPRTVATRAQRRSSPPRWASASSPPTCSRPAFPPECRAAHRHCRSVRGCRSPSAGWQLAVRDRQPQRQRL